METAGWARRPRTCFPGQQALFSGRGKAATAESEACDWPRWGFLDRCHLLVQIKPDLGLICDVGRATGAGSILWVPMHEPTFSLWPCHALNPQSPPTRSEAASRSWRIWGRRRSRPSLQVWPLQLASGCFRVRCTSAFESWEASREYGGTAAPPEKREALAGPSSPGRLSPAASGETRSPPSRPPSYSAASLLFLVSPCCHLDSPPSLGQ